MCNQTNEFVYLGGDVNYNAGLSIEVDHCIRNAWYSFRKCTIEQHDRLSAHLELKIRMLRAEVLETLLYGCVMWPARVPRRYAAPSPPQLSDSLRRMVKGQQHRPPDFLSEHPHEDGKGEH